MYSAQCSPTPSTTAEAPLLRTANRSPAFPAQNNSPPVAPYSTVLPSRYGSPASFSGGRLVDPPPPNPLPDIIVCLPDQDELDPIREECPEALAGRTGKGEGCRSGWCRRPTFPGQCATPSCPSRAAGV